eukprot:gene30487-35504_t
MQAVSIQGIQVGAQASGIHPRDASGSAGKRYPSKGWKWERRQAVSIQGMQVGAQASSTVSIEGMQVGAHASGIHPRDGLRSARKRYASKGWNGSGSVGKRYPSHVDLGTEFMKVAIVRHGSHQLSVVTNEWHKRKSPGLVGFVRDKRMVGDEALSLAHIDPEAVVALGRELGGYDSAWGAPQGGGASRQEGGSCAAS